MGRFEKCQVPDAKESEMTEAVEQVFNCLVGMAGSRQFRPDQLDPELLLRPTSITMSTTAKSSINGTTAPKEPSHFEQQRSALVSEVAVVRTSFSAIYQIPTHHC